MNKKSIVLLIVAFCIVICMSACKGGDNSADKHSVNLSGSPVNVTKNFFDAFESSDYAAMKAYCTDKCVETYFHDGDVDGMIWAKLTESGEEETIDNNTVSVFVTVNMETAKTSALYPETETSFYVELIRDDNGSWLIDGFPTGR